VLARLSTPNGLNLRRYAGNDFSLKERAITQGWGVERKYTDEATAKDGERTLLQADVD
jgi:hypothetical protein